MDVTFRVQRPVWFNQRHKQQQQTSFFNSQNKSFISLFSYKPSIIFSQSYSWHIDCPANGLFCSYSAAGDFSRKKQKKWSSPRSKGRSPKSFAPKVPVGTGSQKSNQMDGEDKTSAASSAPELGTRTTPDVASNTGSDDDRNVLTTSQVNRSEEQWTGTTDTKVGDLSTPSKAVAFASQHLLKEVESVKGLLGEGESSSGTGFGEIILEDESSDDGDEFYSALEAYQKTEVEETMNYEETEVEETVNYQDMEVEETVDYQETEVEEIVNYQETEVEETVSYQDMEVEETVDYQETEVEEIENYQEIVAEEIVNFLETEVEEIMNYQETDVEENVNYLGAISDSISGTEVVGSESQALDAVTSEENEVNDLLTVQEDPSLVSSNSMESEQSDVSGSETIDTETTYMKDLEDSLQKLVLERQAEEARKMELAREAALRKLVLEEMAEDNASKGNKMFIYPGTAKPNEDIEVFFNRSITCLKSEPEIIIMGSFNDWRWKSFAKKLEKTQLRGDWWSCQIHVPSEAYKMEFVFSNGKEMYENNDKNDFYMIVEEGMDMETFEDFLLEEKRRELEELAKEQAEKDRLAEEERKREEEKAAREADRAQAKNEVNKRRENVQTLMTKAITSLENVWFFKPLEFKGGDSVNLYYNRGSGPLSQAKDIWIHGGYNGWENGLSIVANLAKVEEVDGDWWSVEVTVPDQAVVLDWVFADGPPQKASCYDNNNKQDFHAIVPSSKFDEPFWVEEEQRIYQKMQDERRAQEEAIRAKAEKTARMKAETKARTLKTFLLSQRDIVYTDPVDIQAGSDVTVYYNPSNTVLNGKPEVWFRGSFNRWTHRRGPLPPQRMFPAENGTHVKTTVKVPADAYMLDFVFSEKEDGGVFDNKNNMDYHIPVFGAVAKEPPMHIVHIAVELAPIAKVGGLGDVVTSLSRAIQELNHHVDIVLPKYNCVNTNNVKDLHYQRSYSWGGSEIKVWFGKVEGISVYFLDPQNGFFSSGGVYNGRNDGERFGFFCHAALEFLLQSGFHPDIIHCHDWSSAPVAWLYKDHYRQCGLSKARVIFTIHNLEFGANFIAKAMAFADKATTVSDTYSKEVARNPAIAPHLYKFHGILNGIDPDIWDPYNDKFIPVPYTSENVAEGKKAAKELLQQRLSIKKLDVPVVGIISRLTHQKGIHLIKHAIWKTLERGGQVVLLGSAPDPRIQNEFVDLSNQMHNLHNDRARLCLTYDEPLSHLIYAGADFILVPSIFEPCGLTQLVAMRYGSIPVVRKTGGLYDTVFDVDHDQERAKAHGLVPNGFSFEGADGAGVDYALNRAISSWYDGKEWFNTLRQRVMEQDWSWNRPALEYMELYHAARKY